jgi:hypothetical protein
MKSIENKYISNRRVNIIRELIRIENLLSIGLMKSSNIIEEIQMNISLDIADEGPLLLEMYLFSIDFMKMNIQSNEMEMVDCYICDRYIG